MADNRTDEQKARDAEKLLAVLKQIREPYDPEVDNVISYVNHGRKKIREQENKGKRTGVEVYDGTALGALNILVDGMCGYSSSRSFRWFQYTLPGRLNFPKTSGMRAWSGKRMDEYPEVKGWLSECEEVMYACFLRSNWYDVFPEIVRDAGSIGTVSPCMEEDLKAGRVVFETPHFRECYLAENRHGVVDTRYRVYKLTLRDLVEKFGRKKMEEADPAFEQGFEANPFQEREVLHAIQPRKDFEKGRVDSKDMPVASYWVLRSPLKLLGEGGYNEMPSVSWRWRKNNDELYGRSPAWDAMVDVMLAQQQGRTNLIAGQKMAEPPMVAPADLRGMVNTNPKGWTWIQSMQRDMPMPLQTGMQLPFALEMQERTDKKIREHFHVDFFLMLSQAAMAKVSLTATQVLEMSGEKAAVLSTRIGRMETELLNPIHDRCFEIERRAGRIPMPPQILLDMGGQPLEIDYLGPLSQAQKKLFKSQGIRAGLESVMPLLQVFPQAAVVIDPIKTTKDLMEASGFPVKDFRTDEEIQAELQRQQKQEAAAQLLKDASEAAKVIPAAGTAPEEGSPMADLMGAGA